MYRPPVNVFDLNYLAHQHLSFDSEPIMVGNFIADTLRAGQVGKYDRDIRLGIEIHRYIDTYTDAHALPLDTRKLLYPYFGKYAAVVQDMFYDHFLALQWSLYRDTPLPDFSRKVYTVMAQHADQLNPRAARTLHYMEMQDWLTGYARREGIDRALKGLASRAKFQSNMERAVPALEAHFNEMKAHFDLFFPELEHAVHQTFSSRIR